MIGSEPSNEPCNPSVVVVLPPFEIDMGTAPGFAAQIADALNSGVDTVVVELRWVSFCDSSGMRVLIAAVKHARAWNARLVLRNAPARMHRLAELLGATDFLGFSPPVDGA